MTTYGATELPSGVGKHMPAKLHRQALAAMAGICAVTIAAVCLVLSNGTGVYTGLLEVRNERLPYFTVQQLAQMPAWNDQAHETMLAEEKHKVGAKLAAEMQKVWKAKGKAKKQDMQEFSKLKGRFESILAAMEKAPELKRLPETTPRAMRVVDPRTGQVYELLQTLYDYDPAEEGAEWAVHPLFENDLKGLGDFEDAAGRVPTYQGEYPDYDSWADWQGNIAPSGAKMMTGGSVLYPYDPSAEGAEWAVHPLFENDLKGLGDFEDAAGRVPTYQGEYPDYDSWADWQGNIAPSGAKMMTGGSVLYPYDPSAEGAEWAVHPLFENDLKGLGDFESPGERSYTYQGAYPDYDSWADWQGNIAPSGARGVPIMLAVQDSTGQLRLLDPAQVPGLQVPMLAAQARALAQRKQMQQQLSLLRTAQPSAKKVNEKAAMPPKAAKKGKSAGEAKKGQVQMLADLDSSTSRTWGKVYNPKLLPLPAEAKVVDANPLSAEARHEYKQWSTLADNLNDVYDPAEDRNPKHNMQRVEEPALSAKGNWWKAKKFEGGVGSDNWWVHDHKGRGY